MLMVLQEMIREAEEVPYRLTIPFLTTRSNFGKWRSEQVSRHTVSRALKRANYVLNSTAKKSKASRLEEEHMEVSIK